MKNLRQTTIKYGVIVIVIAHMLSATNVIGQEGEGLKRSLEGVWLVTIMPRNCTTGVPIPNAVSRGIYTFHKDGTASVWAQNSTITTTRSPSHGLWRREQGWSDYSLKFVHLRYSQSTGAYLGKQEGRGTLVLSESGDEFLTDGSATVFDINDVPGTPGCSNSSGTRFKLDQ